MNAKKKDKYTLLYGEKFEKHKKRQDLFDIEERSPKTGQKDIFEIIIA